MSNLGKNLDLVSVVMAFHNGDNMSVAKETIESVLAQTHKNIELIVSVGGELSEEKEKVLKELSDRDSRINVLIDPINTGPSRSRNNGVRVAKGKYISIVDSDDIFFGEKIEKQLRYITEKKLDFLGCGYIEFRNDYKAEPGVKRTLPQTIKHIKRALPFVNPVANSALFAKTEVLKEISYNENFKPGDGEDYDLIISLIKAKKIGENLPEPLFYYRLGNNFEKKHANLRCATKDIRHKLRAATTLPPWWIPLILISADIAFLSRLLPPKMFGKMRDLRHKIFGG